MKRTDVLFVSPVASWTSSAWEIPSSSVFHAHTRSYTQPPYSALNEINFRERQLSPVLLFVFPVTLLHTWLFTLFSRPQRPSSNSDRKNKTHNPSTPKIPNYQSWLLLLFLIQRQLLSNLDVARRRDTTSATSESRLPCLHLPTLLLWSNNPGPNPPLSPQKSPPRQHQRRHQTRHPPHRAPRRRQAYLCGDLRRGEGCVEREAYSGVFLFFP